MPVLSKLFEFYNPWSTKNTHTTQVGITFPQMVDGRMPDPTLYLFSAREKAAGYYGLGSRTHSVQYAIEGSFSGILNIQASNMPNPSDIDWLDLPETTMMYTGLETTGGAGISGGFSGAISKPIQTDLVEFTGNYAWVRVKMGFGQGTLQSVSLNF